MRKINYIILYVYFMNKNNLFYAKYSKIYFMLLTKIFGLKSIIYIFNPLN